MISARTVTSISVVGTIIWKLIGINNRRQLETHGGDLLAQEARTHGSLMSSVPCPLLLLPRPWLAPGSGALVLLALAVAACHGLC